MWELGHDCRRVALGELQTGCHDGMTSDGTATGVNLNEHCAELQQKCESLLEEYMNKKNHCIDSTLYLD